MPSLHQASLTGPALSNLRPRSRENQRCKEEFPVVMEDTVGDDLVRPGICSSMEPERMCPQVLRELVDKNGLRSNKHGFTEGKSCLPT